MPGFLGVPAPYRGPATPQASPMGSALNSVADALSRVDQQVEGRAQKKWQMQMQERTVADDEDRTATAQQLQRDQFDASRLATRRAEAAKGVYDTLSPDQSGQQVESYDPVTGEDRGQTNRYQNLGGGLGYQDVTRDPNSDYTRGQTRSIATTRRRQAISEGTAAGLSEADASARYDSDPASVARALEDIDQGGRKAGYDEAHDTRVGRTAIEVARIHEAGENARARRAGAANHDITSRLGALQTQISDARSEGTIANKLDPDSGEPVNPTRARRMQARGDSLQGVYDKLAAEQGNGVGQPGPAAPTPAPQMRGANGGQQAFNAQLPDLIQKRAKAVQKLMAQGLTRQDAEGKASDLYNQAVTQLSQQYGIMQGQPE